MALVYSEFLLVNVFYISSRNRSCSYQWIVVVGLERLRPRDIRAGVFALHLSHPEVSAGGAAAGARVPAAR